MELILTILQILAMLLLALFVIVTILFLLIMFLPIPYFIQGHFYDEMIFEAKAHWFFHLFSIKYSYRDGLLHGELRVLWKRISLSKTIEEKEDEQQGDFKQVSSQRNHNKKKRKKTKKEFHLKEKILAIKEKILYVKRNYQIIKRVVQDDKNKEAFRHLKKEVFKFLSAILPYKSNVKGTFSTGSPDTTGQAFGLIACFPIMYKDHWELVPDFESEKAVFQGFIEGKGRIFVFKLTAITLRILFDKNCRRLYYMLKKLGGKYHDRRE